MGIFDRIRKKKTETRGQDPALAMLIHGTDLAPSQVSDAYTQSTAVFRSVNAICTSLSRVPLKLYKGETEVVSGPLYDLLQNPNSAMDTQQFVSMVAQQMLLSGACFVVLDGVDSRWVPQRLLPLPPTFIAPIRPESVYDLEGWQVMAGSDLGTQLPPSVVAPVVYAVTGNDPLLPVSPLEVAGLAVQTDYLSSVWNKAVIENSGSPAGLLKWEGDISLNEKDRDRIRREWKQAYGGAANAESVAVLGKNFSYEQTGLSPKDMSFLDGRRWNLSEVARAFNVPLLYLNEYQASGLSDAGLKVQSGLFYTETIQPLGKKVTTALNKKLIAPYNADMQLRFDWDSVDALRADYSAKLASAQQLFAMGYPINAINRRLELGMHELEYGEQTFMQSQNITTEAIMANSEAQVSTADALIAANENVAAPEGSGLGSGAVPEAPTDAEQPVGEEEAQAETKTPLEDAASARAAVDVPEFISQNAARGLKYHADGKSGDGVVESTLRDARQMRDGSVSVPKLRKMSAWFARHKSDLDSPANSDPNHEDYPQAGAVAWMLWGGNPTSDPMRAKEWCDRKIAQLDEEEDERDFLDSRDRSVPDGFESRSDYWRAQYSAVSNIEKETNNKIRKSVLKNRRDMLKAISSLGEDEVARAQELVKDNWSSDRVVAAVEFGIDAAGNLGIRRGKAEAQAVLGAAGSNTRADGIDDFDADDPESEEFFEDQMLTEYNENRLPIITEAADRMGSRVFTAVAAAGTVIAVQEAVRRSTNALINGGKSSVIANTETNAAFNNLKVETMQANGAQWFEWLSQADDRVRTPPTSDYNHLIDGEVRDTTAGIPFSTGGGEMYPQDPSGDIGSTINCRCTIVPVSDPNSRGEFKVGFLTRKQLEEI